MKKVLLVIVTMCLILIQGNSQINSGSPAIPFNSKTSYDYGIMPTNLPTSGTYGKSQAAADAYNQWISNFVEVCTVGKRVKFTPEATKTVSEGIGYGMLLSAYAGDKANFDSFWTYYKNNLNSHGIMNWQINGCSGVSGANGATDAELDAAMALIIASTQWPTATSPYNYRTEALYILSKIKQYEIDNSTYQTLNGDAWNSSCRNPSYMAPGYYLEFALFDASNATFWQNSAATANTMLTGNRNSTTGLVGNWCNNYSPYASNNCGPTPNEYGADACRNPWRMATDYLWHGSNAMSVSLDISTKIANWISGYESNLKGPLSQSAANPSVGSYKNGAYSTYALAPMCLASKQTSLNTCYTNVVNLGTETGYYFNSTLRCITLFMMTGNFWKPGTVVTTNPLVSSATTNAAGTTIAVTFNKNMATPAAGQYASFSLKVNGSTVTNAFTAIALSGTTILNLTLSTPITSGQTVTISYTPGTIQSSDANALLTFTNQAVTNAVPGGSTIIADCEAGNETKLLTSWYSYKSGASTITPLSTATIPFTMTLGGANGTDSAAVASGTLVNTSAPAYESAGIGFAFTTTDPIVNATTKMVTNESAVIYDLTGATGISFYHKGAALNFSVISSLTKQDAGEDFNFAVPAHLNWTLVEVPFTSLAQETWATQVTWNPSKVMKLQWQVKGDPARSFNIGIDEVTVMGKVLTLPVSTTVDKTALAAAITSATTIHTAAVEGTAVGQYPTGSKATLLAAISAASTVNANAAATQIQVDAALATLTSAVATFQASVNGAVVSKTALQASISSANSVYAAAVEGTAVGQYPTGSKSALLTAINAASAINSNATATQVQVDAAKTALDAAVATFQASVITVASPNTIIADCEATNETKLLTFWYSYKAGSSSITPLSSATTPFTMTLGGANGTDSAAIATGNLVNTAAPNYESAGIGFAFTTTDPIVNATTKMVTNESAVIYDLTGATGISFYHKGSALNFSVISSLTKQDAGEDFNFAVPAHATWTLVEVPFTSLAQETWATQVTWNPSKVMKLQWQVKGDPARSFNIGIDEVTVMGKTLTLPAAPVNKTLLVAAITSATTIHTTAVEGTAVGQYPTGSKATLLAAINAATTINLNAAATQIQVDAAIATLNATVATFQASVITSLPVSKTALAAAITNANTIYSAAVEGTGNGQYPVGSKTTLLAAINAAQAVNANATATQVQVDAALASLTSAVSTFQASVIVVSKTVLQASIATANNYYTTSTEGTAPGQYPVGSKATLLAAINAASSVNLNTSASQVQVNTANSTLQTAINTFLASVNPTVDKSELTYTISNASTIYTNAVEGTGNGEYPVGSRSTLLAAINAAQAVNTNTSSTQTQVDNATTTLETAVTNFMNSVNGINLTILQDAIDDANTELLLSNGNTGNNPGNYPSSAVDALSLAITTAQTLLNTATTQSQITNAVNTLQDEVLAYQSSIIPTGTVDRSELLTVITNVGNILSNAVLGEEVGQYPAASFQLLSDFYNDALSVYSNTNSSQNEIDAEINTLTTALNDFLESVVTSISKEIIAELVISPNPCTQSISISSGKEISKIAIINLLGATQISKSVYATQTSISVSQIASGIYLVSVTYTDGTIETKKITKK